MTKNITLIGINYFPEDSAIGLYSTQMTEHLIGKGYLVDVITGFPYYPEWEIRDAYKSKPAFLDEEHGDIKIHRYRQYVPKNPSFTKRILHLLDFTIGSFRNLFKIKKCDLVIAVVPFTTSILLGLILAKIRGAKLWVHIQDFEFDAAREAGLAGGGGVSTIIFGLLMKIEAFLLGRADIVSTISYSMLEKLATKTKVPNYFFPNWVDENTINPETAIPHPHLQSEKFKILYSGNIGAKQNWEFFIKIAEHFQESNNIEFVIVGDGARKQKLLQDTLYLENVHHHAPVEFAELSSLLCSADLHILFQKNDIIDTVMPSKILGMMASAKPSIVTGNLASETAKLFKTSKGGYFFDADDFAGVIQAIDALQHQPELANKLGITARIFITEKFSKARVLELFTTKLAAVLAEK